MGKREDRLREAASKLTAKERELHAHKIAQFRAMGLAQPCLNCGLPTAGFVPLGMTMKEAGICTC
jgi:hypothetical protein